LSEYFDVPGAFGDQSFDRHELPRLAAQRVSGQLRMELQSAHTYILGAKPAHSQLFLL
jgi:hypothetical protein